MSQEKAWTDPAGRCMPLATTRPVVFFSTVSGRPAIKVHLLGPHRPPGSRDV